MENNMETPEFLYHTCLRVDHADSKGSESLPEIHVLGTHGTVKAAKRFSLNALKTLGYMATDFDIYQERSSDAQIWDHGDGVIVYAKAPAGQEFTVTIDTKLNTGDLRASPNGSLILPQGADHLHYVLQVTIDYNADRRVSADIQGAYLRRHDAVEAAKVCLFDDDQSESDFDRFDARDSLDTPADWPFGEDVLVHAVQSTGENFVISLKTPPDAFLTHKRYHLHDSKE